MSRLSRAFRYIFQGIPQKDLRAEIVCLEPSKVLEKKKIIVTGGGKGLGRAIAKKLVSEGADVLITGRNEETLEETSKEIGCKYMRLDMCDITSFNNFIQEADQEMCGIDGLINNAGISLHEKTFFDVTPESWDRQFDTNLKGPFFLTQRFIHYLLENKKKGNILFISSETGDTCDIRPYGFTKASINSMLQGLAYRYKLDGIRVNALSPGITASDMTGVAKDGNYYAGSYGQGRFYLPEEIAEVATFLLSDVSDCISGQIITCNNAQTVNARWKK